MIRKLVLEYFKERGISYYHRMRHEGFLRHLLVRKASKTGEILVALVTTSQNPGELEAGEDNVEAIVNLVEGFKQTLLDAETEGKFTGKIAGILHITNDSIADVVKSDNSRYPLFLSSKPILTVQKCFTVLPENMWEI